MKTDLWLSMILLFMFSSCSLPVNREVKLSELSYAQHARGTMDVYLPAGRDKSTPFVILIHGGGWVAGDKAWMRDLQNYLLENGIASANINYRYADKRTSYTQILEDIDNAVLFCENNRDDWNIFHDNFIICGNSAGGHLALLYGYTSSKPVKAIVALCPATDFSDTLFLKTIHGTYIQESLTLITGAASDDGNSIQEAFKKASPVFYTKNVPTLLIHGTNDKTVSYSQSERMRDSLRRHGIDHDLVSIPGAGHDLDIQRVPTTRQLIYGAIVKWVKTYN